MHKIRRALTTEAGLISELAFRSKAHWGYDPEFMQACQNELSHTADQLDEDSYRYFVAELEGDVVGFYKLENLDQETVILDALFVDPAAIGFGIGRSLLEHAMVIADKIGGRYLEAESDPYAESFYRAMGATVTGRTESGSIPGRFLPTIQLVL